MRKILLLGAVLTLLLSAGQQAFAKPIKIITPCGTETWTDDTLWTDAELKEIATLLKNADC